MTISAAVLFVAALGMAASPIAFADHDAATVHNPPGSSAPGCETTPEGCFLPGTVTVDAGEEVRWVNDDTAAHTVTSGVLADGGPDGIFDSGTIPPAGEFSHKFEDAGEYPYFCLVHPWMEGLVIVKEAAGSEIIDKNPTTNTLSDGTRVVIETTWIAADDQLGINIIFVDSRDVNYDIMVSQGGEEVLDIAGIHKYFGKGEHVTDVLSTDDPVDITIVFQGYGTDRITGPVGDKVVFTAIPQVAILEREPNTGLIYKAEYMESTGTITLNLTGSVNRYTVEPELISVGDYECNFIISPDGYDPFDQPQRDFLTISLGPAQRAMMQAMSDPHIYLEAGAMESLRGMAHDATSAPLHGVRQTSSLCVITYGFERPVVDWLRQGGIYTQYTDTIEQAVYAGFDAWSILNPDWQFAKTDANPHIRNSSGL